MPLTRRSPAASASAHCRAPVASASQVTASVSTTFGGVPRVWVRALDALDRAERGHAHLDAAARGARAELLEGEAHGGGERGAVDGIRIGEPRGEC